VLLGLIGGSHELSKLGHGWGYAVLLGPLLIGTYYFRVADRLKERAETMDRSASAHE
jgi:hypothetical protein